MLTSFKYEVTDKMEMIIDVLADAAVDCLKMLPFLFVAFLLIEGLEHYSTKLTRKALEDVDKAGAGRLCTTVWIFGYGF